VNVAKLPELLLDENVLVVRGLVGWGDRILVPQPNRRSSLPYAISYRGNFSSAAAMCSTTGAPYFAPMVLCAWPVM
jgi:hypothetical protein